MALILLGGLLCIDEQGQGYSQRIEQGAGPSDLPKLSKESTLSEQAYITD